MNKASSSTAPDFLLTIGTVHLQHLPWDIHHNGKVNFQNKTKETSSYLYVGWLEITDHVMWQSICIEAILALM